MAIRCGNGAAVFMGRIKQAFLIQPRLELFESHGQSPAPSGVTASQ